MKDLLNVKTAYKNADIYDSARFSTKAGKKIDSMEFIILKKTLRFIPKDSKILEVGCGTSRLLIRLVNKGYILEGIDASPDMLKEAKNKFKPPIKLILGESANLPYENSYYDFVFSIRVLNQTESEEYALNSVSEMIRITKLNGYILLEFVNAGFWKSHFFGLKRKGVNLKPIQVIKKAEESGAKKVKSYGNFFFGMTPYHNLPAFLIKPFSFVDMFFCFLFPGLCSRHYILFQKI